MKIKKVAVLLGMVVMMVFSATACGSQNKGNDSALENQQPENQQSENQQPKNQQSENQQPENQQPENQQPENQQPENQQPENQQPENQQPESQQPENRQPENQNSNENKGQGAGTFNEQADLEGSVYDFTKTGFSLSPAKSYEDGEGSVMVQAAPGSEDEDELVSITYADNCTFRIVVMDAASLKEVSNEDTTSESIKKQTQVKVYGSCQDTKHWTAERVTIVRWQ